MTGGAKPRILNPAGGSPGIIAARGIVGPLVQPLTAYHSALNIKLVPGTHSISIVPPYVDFDLWTENDTDGSRTVNDTQIQVDDTTEDDTGYIYYDEGADNIGDFNVKFKLSNAFSSGSGFQTLGTYILGFTQNLGNLNKPNNGGNVGNGFGLAIFLNAFGALTFRPVLEHGNAHQITPPAMDMVLSQNTDYWGVIDRTGTTISVEIYTDSDRTILADSASQVVSFGNDTYRYSMAAWGPNAATTTRFIDYLLSEVMIDYS